MISVSPSSPPSLPYVPSAVGRTSQSSGTPSQPDQVPGAVLPPFDPAAGCTKCAGGVCDACGNKRLSELKKADPELFEKVAQRLVSTQPQGESIVAQAMGGSLPIPKCSAAEVEKALVAVMLDELPAEAANLLRSQLSSAPSLNEFLDVLGKNHANPILQESFQSAGIALSDVQAFVLNTQSSLDPKLHQLQQMEQARVQDSPTLQREFAQAIQAVKNGSVEQVAPKEGVAKQVTEQARDTLSQASASAKPTTKDPATDTHALDQKSVGQKGVEQASEHSKTTQTIQKNDVQPSGEAIQKTVQMLQKTDGMSLSPIQTQALTQSLTQLTSRQLTVFTTLLSQLSGPTTSALVTVILQAPSNQAQSFIQGLVQLSPQNAQAFAKAMDMLPPTQIQGLIQLLSQFPARQINSMLMLLSQFSSPKQSAAFLGAALVLPSAQAMSVMSVLAQLSPQHSQIIARVMSGLSPIQIQGFVQLLGQLTATQATQVLTLLIRLPIQLQGKMALVLANFSKLPPQSIQMLMTLLSSVLQKHGIEGIARFLNSLPAHVLEDPQQILALLEEFLQHPNRASAEQSSLAAKLAGRQPEDIANLLHLFANEEDKKDYRKKRLRTRQSEKTGFTDALSRLFAATDEADWKQAADFRIMLADRALSKVL